MSGADHGFKYVFVDNGHRKGEDFFDGFIKSNAWTNRGLNQIAPRGHKSGPKATLVEGVKLSYETGDLSGPAIMAACAQQPQRYLALRKGSVSALATLGHVGELHREFGAEGWHGPLLDEEDLTRAHYVYVLPVVDDFLESNEQGNPSKKTRRVRWTIFADVCSEYVSFHWSGFSVGKIEKRERVLAIARASFEFWKHVDHAIDGLQESLGASWDPVHISNLVYSKMWSRYLNNEKYEWSHVSVNAERDGVALNANGTISVGMEGLGHLTRKLSTNITKMLRKSHAIELPTDDIESELRNGLIRDWGTRNYTFGLVSLKEGPCILARAYMGNVMGARGLPYSADGLAHFFCYEKTGGSVGAAEFLAKLL